MGKWKINDRFWQDETWASDVNDILWGLSGEYLYVATSNIYGDGKLFQLGLRERKADMRKVYSF